MTELRYISVEEAIPLKGLRVAFTQGLPGPWGLSARAILDYKRIPYAAVVQEAGGANDALLAWTGQTSAPVAMLDEERPRALWSEILLLAERLAPEPRLIPADPAERMTMFGLAHELCGEDGVGASARTLLLLNDRSGRPHVPRLVEKYCAGAAVEHAARRLNQLIALLAARLEQQAAAGSAYLVGDALSAADIYWVAFSTLIDALPEDICIMPDFYRALGGVTQPFLDAQLPENLIAHRDRVARAYLPVPFRF